MNPTYCPVCQSYLCSCPPLFRKETPVPEPIAEEAETAARRGISSLSPPLQALAKIDRLLADMDPRVVARILDFLTAVNAERLENS